MCSVARRPLVNSIHCDNMRLGRPVRHAKSLLAWSSKTSCWSHEAAACPPQELGCWTARNAADLPGRRVVCHRTFQSWSAGLEQIAQWLFTSHAGSQGYLPSSRTRCRPTAAWATCAASLPGLMPRSPATTKTTCRAPYTIGNCTSRCLIAGK